MVHPGFHSRQGNLIPFCHALVHQRVRDRTDEAHVDSEAEAKLLILCVVSIERWRLVQAPQVLEQVGILVQRTGSANVHEYKMTVWLHLFHVGNADLVFSATPPWISQGFLIQFRRTRQWGRRRSEGRWERSCRSVLWHMRQHVRHDGILLETPQCAILSRVGPWATRVRVVSETSARAMCGWPVRAQMCRASDTSRRLSGSSSPGQPKKFFMNVQTVKNAKNSNFLSSNCCVPNVWTRTMATMATGFPALVYRTSSPFEDRLHCRILQYLRTLVLLFVLLVGFEEWF